MKGEDCKTKATHARLMGTKEKRKTNRELNCKKRAPLELKEGEQQTLRKTEEIMLRDGEDTLEVYKNEEKLRIQSGIEASSPHDAKEYSGGEEKGRNFPGTYEKTEAGKKHPIFEKRGRKKKYRKHTGTTERKIELSLKWMKTGKKEGR